MLFVGVVALVLFSASYLVDVRIIVENPNYGDVTAGVRTLWRVILGITTVGSFAIGIYNLTTDGNGDSGPSTGFKIEGEGHDVDVHLHWSRERRERVGGESEPVQEESDDDSSHPGEKGDAGTDAEGEEQTDTTRG
ncbi:MULTISPECIES: hypothetical protein [Halococcus]|uniref:hypothetical protein n=1 Tax=Halococcus TaxID=2249 RepID=UPI001267E1E0|nr:MULTISPECIES: hypothetical protein [Halococcus]